MESLFYLVASAVVAICLGILGFSCWRFVRSKRLSPARWVMTILAVIPVAIFVGAMMFDSETNYNPGDASLQKIAGTYANGEASLVLRLDGTYSSQNLKDIGSGTWSHFDWNLTLRGSSLEKPRWIKWRGTPAILPYYKGAGGDDGLILVKQGE
jgi:hypothetical protein